MAKKGLVFCLRNERFLFSKEGHPPDVFKTSYADARRCVVGSFKMRAEWSVENLVGHVLHSNFFPLFIDSILLPPLLRQLATRGGGEDGLAEAFEEGGDAVEAGAAGVHPPQDQLQLVRDPLLFGEGWEIKRKLLNLSQINPWACRTMNILFQSYERGMRCETPNEEFGKTLLLIQSNAKAV